MCKKLYRMTMTLVSRVWAHYCLIATNTWSADTVMGLNNRKECVASYSKSRVKGERQFCMEAELVPKTQTYTEMIHLESQLSAGSPLWCLMCSSCILRRPDTEPWSEECELMGETTDGVLRHKSKATGWLYLLYKRADPLLLLVDRRLIYYCKNFSMTEIFLIISPRFISEF